VSQDRANSESRSVLARAVLIMLTWLIAQSRRYCILGLIRRGIVATKEEEKGENTCQVIAELLTSNQAPSR